MSERMILSLGEAIVDLLPLRGGAHDFHAALGGSPFNVALGLGRLGARAAYGGPLSSDANGERFMQALAEANVDARNVTRVDAPSALAFVTRNERTGHPSYSFHITSSAHDTTPVLPDPWPKDIGHFHVGSFAAMTGAWAAPVLKLMQRARQSGTVSFDPNIRPLLMPSREASVALVEERVALSHIVKASEEDLSWLYPDERASNIAERWARSGPSIVVLTKGESGAEAFFDDAQVVESTAPFSVEDTVGAGDCFMAALLAQMQREGMLGHDLLGLNKQQVQHWLDFANRAAGLSCKHKGSYTPTWAEVEELMRCL